ncbi:sodium-independent sulfate anion transporter-like isoform X1 [Bacillus rossius redtenbacheri]|uniref:sodium-independent sulfate anion transporter-like isoform X1 n=1 Tax=Bacillus rossius redtenbacheri TaxID=93214 RepID=UPI002FDECE4C
MSSEVGQRDSGKPASWKERAARAADGAMCSRSLLERKLPVAAWLPRYRREDLLHDAVAGVAVGLTAVPQGIAYAVVAGLEPQYGLYAAMTGPFVYVALGSCKDITIGPTAILALLTQSFVSAHGADFAVLLAFLSGCVVFALGLLRMGFLVDFISMPVTVAFTSAAAITIASSQVKDLLGFGGQANNFVQACANLLSRAGRARLWDSALGLTTVAVLLLGKVLGASSAVRTGPERGVWRRAASSALWLLCVARNAVVVLAGALVAYLLHLHGVAPFRLTGEIEEGLPPFRPPPFSTRVNGTEYSFVQMARQMGASLAVVPLIAILESVAIAKSFSKGKSIDATQEMLALGMSNILGSFVRSMPVTGSFTRTAVNNASGVRTPLGGLVTGTLIVLALRFLTATFYFIPKASLGGVIVCAMFFMVDYRVVPLLWSTKKLDLVPFFVTFTCGLLLSLEYGILLGVAADVVFILYESARPSVTIKHVTVSGNDVLLVRPEHGLVFPAAEYVRDMIVARCSAEERPVFLVVVDGTHVFSVDATTAKNMKLLTEDLGVRRQALVFWNWRGSVEKTCRGLDPCMGAYFRYGSTLQDLFPGEDNSRVSRNEDMTPVLAAEG